MKFDMSKFKKVKEDGRAAVLQHPDGHKIMIAKSALSGQMQNQLRDLPTVMAEGGEVQDPEEDDVLSSWDNLSSQFNQQQPQDQQMQNTLSPLGSTEQPQSNLPSDDSWQGLGHYFKKKREEYDAGMAQGYKAKLLDPKLPASEKNKILDMQELEMKGSQEDAKLKAADMEQQRAEVLRYNERAKAMNLPLAQVPGENLMAGTDSVDVGAAPSAAPAAQPSVNPSAPTVVGGETKVIGQGPKFESAGAQKIYGIQQEALHQSQLEQQKADYYAKKQKDDEILANQFQQDRQRLLDERQAFLKDYKDGHIDPQHYIKSQTTGQKVATMIGLALSGWGQGMAGGNNPALEMFNKAIDDDMRSQEASIGKAKSLLDFNRQQLGDLQASYDAAKAQKMAILADQISEASARSNSQIVKDRGMQLAAEVMATSDKLSEGAVLRSYLASGKLPASAQAALPPELAEKAVKLPSGKLAMARTAAEASKLSEQFGTYDNIASGLQNIRNLMKTNGRTLPGTDANAVASAAQELVALNLRKLFELNRMDANQFKLYSNLVGNPGAWDQGETKKKLDQLELYISNLRQSDMNNLLIGGNVTPGSASGAQMAPPNLSGMKK